MRVSAATSLRSASLNVEIAVRDLLRIFILLCAATYPGVRAQAPTSNDSVTTLFGHLIAERAVLAQQADTAGFRRLIDPAVVYLNDDGARESTDQHIRSLLNRRDELTSSRWENDSLHVTVIGDVALIDYRSIQHRRYGLRDLNFRYRCLDVFVRREGAWLLLRHTETHALAQPIPQKVGASVLDDYVGRYEWWPGYFDSITRRGGQLFMQLTGEAGATMSRAATPESFYFAGDPSLVVFTRDKSGHVVGYVEHEPDGQVIRARRVP